MVDLSTNRRTLASGITLNVATWGAQSREAIVLLHGFPESHRTWRAIAPALAEDYFVVAPDQRGFGGSDRPIGVEQYRPDRIVRDLIELADALQLGQFTLVGHDFGGAIAWRAAAQYPDRVQRLVIINGAHPRVFQRSLIESSQQRAASQYIRRFRHPDMEAAIASMGLDVFFGRIFGGLADVSAIPHEERAKYTADWSAPGALTAMLNWYRANELVVPAPGEAAKEPDWVRKPFPILAMPVLVVWGMLDTALLPIQLEGLEALATELRVLKVADAGHFITWENPQPVIAAILAFAPNR